MTKDEEEETLPAKRSKHFANKDVSAPKPARESAASTVSKRKSPAKPATAKAAKASPAKKKPEKSASKGRKAIIIDSDDEDNNDDDDFQVLQHPQHTE